MIKKFWKAFFPPKLLPPPGYWALRPQGKFYVANWNKSVGRAMRSK